MKSTPRSGPHAVFPFLVGCPRSGTTLLRVMLDSHSQLAIPGESHFLPALARRRDRYEREGGFATDAFLEDVLAEERLRSWGLDAGHVRAAVVAASPRSLADGVRALYAAYAAARGKPLYGDKTPGYVRELPLLAELFPEARFVHLVRDGRDVVLSLREQPWAQRGDLELLARFWCDNVELGAAAGEALGPGRYLEVRYERLIEDPERELRAVCTFLDLAWEPQLVAYHEQSARLDRVLPPDVHHARTRLPPTRGLRDWRTQMDAADVARIEGVAAATLTRLGYECCS